MNSPATPTTDLAALLATIAAYLRAHNRRPAGAREGQMTNDEQRNPRPHDEDRGAQHAADGVPF